MKPGQIIDRYVVDATIGSGGTAMVYRVRHRQLGTIHALKVLSVSSPSIRERMLREGRVQAELRHLNVVAVTDILDIDGDPGLLLEFVEGPSLEDALRRYKIGLYEAEILFLGIISGVKHAHAAGLVHRDLKPANVLLAKTANGFVPKVTDFGLAKILQGETLGTGATRNGIAMGTPHYMAPEQIRDARNVDQRADVFSLGCLLYELCTGARAFPGDDALTIYNAVIVGEYVLPRDLVPDLPDRFDSAIRGALAIDPNDRIPDASALLAVVKGERTWNVVEPRSPRSSGEITVNERRSLDSQQRPFPPVAPRPSRTPAPAPGRISNPASLRSTDNATDEAPAAAAAGFDGAVATDTAEVTSPGGALGGFELGTVVAAGHLDADGTLGAQDSLESHDPNPTRVVVVAASVLLAGTFAVAMVLAAVFAAILGDFGRAPAPVAAAPPPVVAPAPPAAPPAPALAATPTPRAPTPTPVAPLAVAAPAPRPAVEAPRPAVAKAAPAAATPTVVKLLTQPATLEVRIGGIDRGKSPVKLELLPGSYDVEVAMGAERHRFAIDVPTAGEGRWCHLFATDDTRPGLCPR